MKALPRHHHSRTFTSERCLRHIVQLNPRVALLFLLVAACGGRVRIEQSAGTADQAGLGGVAGAVGVAGLGGVASSSRGGASGTESLAGATGLIAGAGAAAEGGFVGLGGAPGGSGAGASGSGNLAGSAGAQNCGTPCNPDGDLCHVGVTSCSAGQVACLSSGNVADGTACGADGGMDQVCTSGVCSSCGAPCTPAGTPCQAGVISCNTEPPTCVATGTAKNTTLCGASGICCGGTCTTCLATTNVVEICTTNNTCAVSCNDELTLCGDRCADTTSDNNACGAGCNVCAAGSICFNSQCSTEQGRPTAFSPCNAVNGTIRSGIMVGQRVRLAPSTVTGLGVISTQSGAVAMALYSSNQMGDPLSPFAQTQSTGINPGPNELLTNSPTQVPDGIYWVMAEFRQNTVVCADSSLSNSIDFGPEPYGTFPSSWVAPSTVRGGNYNFYVLVH
jgi:hypothetical protein